MDDDRIKVMFGGFDPEFSPDNEFMTRLERNLNLIEGIKKSNVAFRKRMRRAVLFSGIAGFVVGTVMSLAVSYMTDWISTAQFSFLRTAYFPTGRFVSLLCEGGQVLAWLIVGLMSVITAISVYDLTSGTTRHEAVPSRRN